MEKKLSETYDVKFNIDHFNERESLFNECLHFGALHWDNIDDNDIRDCVDKINELDSSFPFAVINRHYIAALSEIYPYCDRFSEAITLILDYFKQIYNPRDYHDVIDIFSKLPADFCSRNNKEYIDPRIIKLMDCYHNLGRDIVEARGYKSEFEVSGYRYIGACMAAETFISLEDDYESVYKKIYELASTFDLKEYAKVMNLIELTKHKDFFHYPRHCIGPNDEYENLRLYQRKVVYDYIYQHLIESKKNENRIR